MKKMMKIAGLTLAAVMAVSVTAMADDTWKIGGIGPTTGDAAAYGSAVQYAMEIAVDEINEAGGINGAQVEMKFQDDEHDAEKSVAAYNTLKDWGMQMLVGSVTSTPCVAVAAKTYEDSMFQITPSGSSPDCILNDNAFAVCFSDPAQGTMSARYIGENKLAEKVAVIYNSSDVYSSGIYNNFMEESQNQDFEVVASSQFTADSNKDFSVQLQQAMEAEADLVFLPIYYQEASLILTQAAGMDFAPVFFGVDGMDGILGVENFDTTLAEGVLLLTPFVATAEDEATQNFVAKYQEAHGEIPNQFAADAYDALYIIKMAAEKAGLTPDMSVADINEGMKTAITEITYDGLTGTGTTWDVSGAPTKEPKAMVIKDGAYAAVE